MKRCGLVVKLRFCWKSLRRDMKSKMKAHTRAYQIVILLSDSPSPHLFA